tara:strand:- start:49 stop:444 length:396 start_codon:yes stop_codon:yes gene_type:complete
MQPMDRQQTFELLYDNYFNSKEWWMFICPLETNYMMTTIEDKYFSGDNNKHFHMITFLPHGAIYLARKSYITRSEINQVLENGHNHTVKQQYQHNSTSGDVFFLRTVEFDDVFFHEVQNGLHDVHQIRCGK